MSSDSGDVAKGRNQLARLAESVKRKLGIMSFEDLMSEYREADSRARQRAVSGLAARANQDPRALRALFDALWDPSREVQRVAMEKLFTNLSPHIYDDFVILEQVEPDKRFHFIHRRYTEIIRDKIFAGRELDPDQTAKVAEAVLWKYPTSPES